MMIDTNCKACRKPIRVEADDECPESWIQKLLPMVTCERCMHMKGERDTAYQVIESACKQLSILARTARADHPNVEKLKKTLENGTRKYAKWLSMYWPKLDQIYDEGLVDKICKEPDRWGLIMQDFKSATMAEYRARKQEMLL